MNKHELVLKCFKNVWEEKQVIFYNYMMVHAHLALKCFKKGRVDANSAKQLEPTTPGHALPLHLARQRADGSPHQSSRAQSLEGRAPVPEPRAQSAPHPPVAGCGALWHRPAHPCHQCYPQGQGHQLEWWGCHDALENAATPVGECRTNMGRKYQGHWQAPAQCSSGPQFPTHSLPRLLGAAACRVGTKTREITKCISEALSIDPYLEDCWGLNWPCMALRHNNNVTK